MEKNSFSSEDGLGLFFRIHSFIRGCGDAVAIAHCNLGDSLYGHLKAAGSTSSILCSKQQTSNVEIVWVKFHSGVPRNKQVLFLKKTNLFVDHNQDHIYAPRFSAKVIFACKTVKSNWIISERQDSQTCVHPPIMYDNVFFLIPPCIQVTGYQVPTWALQKRSWYQ